MILVTGGTGLVGSNLLFSLLKDNENIRAIYRSPETLEVVKKVFSYYTDDSELLFNKIEWVLATLNDIPSLSSAFDGVTHVYHSAGFIDFDPKNYHELKKTNVEGTANIVNLCLFHKVHKLCHVSSVSALGTDFNGVPMDEESTWNPEDNNSPYAITKYGAEMEVWRGANEGLNTVIVNPGVILGETNWNTGSGMIIKTASKGISFYTPGGLAIVDVIDVVKAMILLMKSPVRNQRFILVGKNIHYKELFILFATYFNRKPPKKIVPKWVLSSIGKLDWFAGAAFGMKRKLVKTTIRYLYATSFYDSSKIARELSFTFTPLHHTIERIIKNYNSQP